VASKAHAAVNRAARVVRADRPAIANPSNQSNRRATQPAHEKVRRSCRICFM
jgi:hypothetical protein